MKPTKEEISAPEKKNADQETTEKNNNQNDVIPDKVEIINEKVVNDEAPPQEYDC